MAAGSEGTLHTEGPEGTSRPVGALRPEGALKAEQKELADFIRVGSTRGHQCFGSYFDEKGGSCALGAVYEGVYHLPRAHGKLIPDHLERLFRCLDEVTKPCPQGCKKRLPLASMIVHLNDDHRMTREQIAEWLTQESNG